MQILVTGTSGQIGSVIARMLSSDHAVVGVDLIPGKHTTNLGNLNDRDFIFSVTKDMDIVIHAASLHAPHIKEYTPEAFIDTNVKGTQTLLEASIKNRIQRFIYTSTTSLYGYAMVPSEKAVWVTESLRPKPRDIYDVTKIAAENMCRLMSETHGLSCLSLRISRFFPEPVHLMVIYRLYRGVDVRDAAAAHILALEADISGYDVFNISARSPFSEDEMPELLHDAPSVIGRLFPSLEVLFAQQGWKLPQSIDRVYVIEKAEKHLGYRPKYNFNEYLQELTR
jgi:nucleoside-diphosphate-sugar epimerase